jgi:two-component system nitrogen regulation sensor histidine kinase NtrY
MKILPMRTPSSFLRFPARILWLRNRLNSSWDGRVAAFLTVFAVLCGVATYAALNSAPPFGDNPDAVIWLLNLDLVVLLVTVVLVARRIAMLMTFWRRGIPGARLHIRLVYIFGLLAIVPSVIMTVFSLFFFHYGVQSWFSERVRTAVQESQAVAESYLREHHQVIRADILAMANDLNRQADLVYTNPLGFEKFVQTQSLLRNLSEVVIFDSSGNVLTEAGLSIGFDPSEVPEFAIDRAKDGEVVVLTSPEDDRVRSLVRLTGFSDSFLFVGRMIEANVLGHVAAAKAASQRYDEVATRYAGLRMTVTMIYIVVAVVLLFAAMWFGLVFARRLALPISTLIEASDRVRQGDLTALVPEDNGLEEFDYLSRSFNRMTQQIRDQRNELVEANRQMDQRRRFTETILSGVSSGVLSVDRFGDVNLANGVAANILQKNNEELKGLKIHQVFPEAEELLTQAYAKPGKVQQHEVPHTLPDGSRRTLLLRIAVELIGDEDQGAVITFDDITNLQSAQRKAAWADVARRIAHEIKNPLTPIQLSAERLKRKYMGTLPESDQQVFSQCIDTIIRHVGDIGHMVNEFSSFARMPEPVMKTIDLKSCLKDILAFTQQAHAGISLLPRGLLNESGPVPVMCDEQQIRQAVTNILQNAADSIFERQKKERDAPKGRMSVWLAHGEDNTILISVADNGMGLPQGRDPQTLVEPYVTLKEKGTGLGLAIVKKIMEDHGGSIIFGVTDHVRGIPGWEDQGGAVVTLELPLRQDSVHEIEQNNSESR